MSAEDNRQIPTREEMAQALIERHGRQLHERFSAARVAVCGIGGLGSNIAIALARAGVGTLHLIDFDRVDITNLNRQQYTVSQLGMKKTDALSRTLREIAPYCTIITDTVRITEENAAQLLAEDSYICEAFDRAEAKAMLVNAFTEHFPEKYLVCGSGMAGLASSNTITTRRLSSRIFLCGDGTSDIADGLGLISARVMLCAAHQANMILRLIAGETQP